MRSRIGLVIVVGLFSLSSYARTFVSSCINTYISSGKYGERFFLDSTNRNSGIQNPEQLRMMSQNFENLGQFKEKSRVKQMVDGVLKEIKIEKTIEKSHGQNLRMAARIRKQDPDIIIGMEVKDQDAAQKFSEQYLEDKYQAILIEGNDSRGIDVCFFVKRSLNLDFEVESHRKYSVTNLPNDPVFSRDLPVLYVRPAGAPKNSAPIMAVLASHLKSKMGDTPEKDKSVVKRAEQVNASVAIIEEIKKKYPGIPIVMGGDFNNDVRVAPEFLPFYKSGLADSLDYDKNPIAKDQRNTQYFFKLDDTTLEDKYDSFLISNQLDAMFVNSEFGRYILASGIQRDVRPDGTASTDPLTPEAVNKRASDHDGLFVILDFVSMLKRLLP